MPYGVGFYTVRCWFLSVFLFIIVCILVIAMVRQILHIQTLYFHIQTPKSIHTNALFSHTDVKKYTLIIDSIIDKLIDKLIDVL